MASDSLRRTFLRSLSAVVLAGGASRRFGSDKTKALWNGRSLLAHVASGLAELVDDVVVVTRRRAPLRAPRLRVVSDRYEEFHPMGGLATGLAACRHRAAFVCAADMPLIAPGLVALLAEASAGYEAAVPVWEGRLQPLCAVYAKSTLGVMRSSIAEGALVLGELFNTVPTRFVLPEEVRAVDPRGRSFLDIDTAADLRRLRRTEA